VQHYLPYRRTVRLQLLSWSFQNWWEIALGSCRLIRQWQHRTLGRGSRSAVRLPLVRIWFAKLVKRQLVCSNVASSIQLLGCDVEFCRRDAVHFVVSIAVLGWLPALDVRAIKLSKGVFMSWRSVCSDTTRRRVVDTFTAWTTVTYQWTYSDPVDSVCRSWRHKQQEAQLSQRSHACLVLLSILVSRWRLLWVEGLICWL